jgi:hypothetical protein
MLDVPWCNNNVSTRTVFDIAPGGRYNRAVRVEPVFAFIRMRR